MSKGKAKTNKELEEDLTRLYENKVGGLQSLSLIAASRKNEDLYDEPLAQVIKDPRQDPALIKALIDFFQKK